MDDRCMYDDDKKTKGKVMIGYGQESAGWRSPVGMTDVGYRDFTVSYTDSRIVWVSTVEYHGLPERKKYPKVFS